MTRRLKEPFIAYRRSMLESPAWRLMPPFARRVLNAVELEHLKHGGKDNGRLVVTYLDLRRYCCTDNRNLLARAVRELEALGFVVVVRGRGGNGRDRAPNMFGLTYLPGHNGSPASDDWRDVRTEAEARERLAGTHTKRPPSSWFKAARGTETLQ